MEYTLNQINDQLLLDMDQPLPSSYTHIAEALAGCVFLLHKHIDKKLLELGDIKYKEPTQAGSIANVLAMVKTNPKVDNAWVQPCYEGPGSCKIIVKPLAEAPDLEVVEKNVQSLLAPAQVAVSDLSEFEKQIIHFKIRIKENNQETKDQVKDALQNLFKYELGPWLGGYEYNAGYLYNDNSELVPGIIKLSMIYDVLIGIESKTPTVLTPAQNIVLKPGHIPVLGEITFETH